MSEPNETQAAEVSPAGYDEDFGIEPVILYKRRKALEHARDNRKFEIELYWKRATYFWTLITATFAGYFAIAASSVASSERDFLAFIVSCLGLVFTFAWLQVDRGSKQWQANWEAHVDLLENEVTGPLYKTVLKKEVTNRDWLDEHVTGSAPMSVSKINQIVNLFVLAVWGYLMLHAAWPISWLPCLPPYVVLPLKFGIPFIFALYILQLILTRGATDGSNQTHKATKRTSSIAG